MLSLTSAVVYSDRMSKILEALESSDYRFFLTGSRYFGTHRQDSDLDLFAKASPEVSDFLRRLGFRHVGHNYGPRTDSLTEEVFRKDNVDVQLVSDLAAKLAIQYALSRVRLLERVNHQEHHEVWGAMYGAYQAGQRNLGRELSDA